MKQHFNTRKPNIFKQIWQSDRILLTILCAICAFFVSFTGFRMLYIQHKVFAAVCVCIALIVLVLVMFYLIINKCGGAAKAAQRLRNMKPVLLALMLAGGITVFIFGVYTLSPIGDYTVLRMDLYHQYGPLFTELYDKIAAGKSLLYSWNSAGGSGFLGNFFNYLSSPFTLMIFWFSKTKVVSTGISVIVFSKCITSAGTFAYYLKKKYQKNEYSIPAFALLYAFSAYFIAYFWNVMWLDAVLIFPLVILGIERIIDRSQGKLYFIALIYTFLTNYYMSYMVCIFSVAYFIIYYLSNYKLGELYVPKTRDLPKFSSIRQSRLLCAGLRFAGMSLLAAVCCAAVLLPIYKVLSSSSATKDSFPSEPKLYFDIFNFIASHLASLEPTIRSSGESVTPNLYCGIISVLLFPLYLMNKRIAWKEKVLNLVFLSAIFACCNLNFTNFVLHGFHFPNDLPYRFSFMYSFLLLVCAHKVFRHIRDYNYKTMVLLGGTFVLICVLAQKFGLKYVHADTIYFSIAFFVVYTLLICASISQKLNKVMTGAVLCCAVVCEVLVCDVPKFEFGVRESDYVEDYEQYQKAINTIYSEDNDTYRIELNDIPTGLRMSPCWYNYEGLNCFSSMANEAYTQMQFRLGNFSNKINSFMYHNQTPIYNLMFNIKYVIDNNDPMKLNEHYYEYLFGSSEKLTAYENRYASSLGFAVNCDIAKVWTTQEAEPNRFKLQNRFLQLATGLEEDFFEPVKLYTDGATGCSMTSFNNTGDGSFSLSVFDANGEAKANFGLSFTAEKTGNYYLYLASLKDFNKADIQTQTYSKTQQIGHEPYLLDLGELQEGEEVKIKTYLEDDSTSADGYLWAVRFNDEAFEKAYRILNDEGMLRVTEKTDTYLKGEFTANAGEILYTSIPYDSGWSCYVDGVQVKPYQLNNTLIGVETGEGTHTVEFRYRPPGLKTGLLISAVGIGCIALYYVIKKSVIYAISVATDRLLNQQ